MRKCVFSILAAMLVMSKHILDALIGHGVNVTAIFSPEHGFRGTEEVRMQIEACCTAKEIKAGF